MSDGLDFLGRLCAAFLAALLLACLASREMLFYWKVMRGENEDGIG